MYLCQTSLHPTDLSFLSCYCMYPCLFVSIRHNPMFYPNFIVQTLFLHVLSKGASNVWLSGPLLFCHRRTLFYQHLVVWTVQPDHWNLVKRNLADNKTSFREEWSSVSSCNTRGVWRMTLGHEFVLHLPAFPLPASPKSLLIAGCLVVHEQRK